LVGGFKLKSDLSLLEKNSRNTDIMFSRYYPCVPVSHAKRYRRKLKNSRIIVYESKGGHFKISKFPEIVRYIKRDLKAIK
jgi:pimeloyl-ACP methyl ester carboxylesterase